MARVNESNSSKVLAHSLRELGITRQDVLDAFAKVPRNKFLPASFCSRARDNDALPIGYGQTTSQPWVIARMLELVLPTTAAHKVLEVGTGCGYQTALLTHLADEVYSLERIEVLLTQARRQLRELEYFTPRLAHRNGMQGLPEAAPFDAIIVCAATCKVPTALLEQLAPGGKLVIPENRGDHEVLTVYCNDKCTNHDEVMFVPLLEGVA